MKKPLVLCIGAMLLAAGAFADPPGWWSDTPNGTAFIDTGASINNYVPLNIGQLKNVASKAKIYLDNQLGPVGGAGPTIDAMVGNFTTNATLNYQPANLGQLKAVAKPFYDRLIAVGYNTTANLISQGYAGNYTGAYPWNPSTPTSQNYVPANLGQLKMVFSFDLSSFTLSSTLSTNSFGIYDAWLVTYGLNPFDSNIGNENPNGDGLTIKGDFELGLNPIVNLEANTTYHVQYQYDALGRLTSVSGPSIAGNYTYDNETNPTQTH